MLEASAREPVWQVSYFANSENEDKNVSDATKARTLGNKLDKVLSRNDTIRDEANSFINNLDIWIVSPRDLDVVHLTYRVVNIKHNLMPQS
jgi:hypothetical protein